MSIPQTVGEVLAKHVILELESLDLVYLNVYQPKLQTPKAVFWFLREYYGPGAISSRCMKAITENFLKETDNYAKEHQIPVIQFQKKQRKRSQRSISGSLTGGRGSCSSVRPKRRRGRSARKAAVTVAARPTFGSWRPRPSST